MNEQFYPLTEAQILGMCCWAEARGEPAEGQQAVMNVIKNRTIKGGWFLDKNILAAGLSKYHAAILKPMQFSSFNQDDPNRGKMMAMIAGQKFPFVDMAQQVIDGTLPDNTGGATYYVNLSVCNPGWAKDMTVTAEIGHHTFMV